MPEKAAGVLGRLTSAFPMQICTGKKVRSDPDSNSRPVARVSLSRWFVVLLAMLAALTALRCAPVGWAVPQQEGQGQNNPINQC